ncbi:MAG TPA: hypothetical protein DIU15_17125 [Deltaproteobacteria bacterium]|nr:hypothetical protein [Deltaproteobacteria bacterium]
MRATHPESERGRWNALAGFVLRARGLGIVFLLIGILATASLSLLRFDFSPQTLFDTTSERAQIYFEHRERYGADDHILIFLVEADLRTATAWQLVEELETRVLAEIPETERTWSPLSLDVPRVGSGNSITISPLHDGVPKTDEEASALLNAARTHPLLRQHLVSDDGAVSAVALKVGDDVAAISQVKPLVENLRRIASESASQYPDTQVHLLGAHAYRSTVVDLMVREELRFAPLTAAVLALILWLIFRTTLGVLVPLLSVLLGALLTLATMALTGQGINIINTITATLVLVIGAADAIHMMTRYRQDRDGGLERSEAMRQALCSVGAACFLTSLTTAVGFATLLTAQLPILRSFGLYAAIGVMLTFGMTIVFVPWALVRSKKDPIAPTQRTNSPGSSEGWLRRCLAAQAKLVIRYHRRVVVISVAIAALFLAGIPRASIDNFIMEYVPRSYSIVAAHKLMEEKLSGVVYVDLVLTAPATPTASPNQAELPAEPWKDPDLLARAGHAEQQILADPAIHSIDSPLGLLRELKYVQSGGEAAGAARDALPGSRQEAAQLLLLLEMSSPESLAITHLSPDRRILRMTVRAADLGARRYLVLEDTMRRHLDLAFQGASVPIEITITGTSQVGYSGIDSLIRDLLTSLAWAFVLIFITLRLLFRSWSLAALAMGPNMLPILAVLGGMGWAGRHLETLSAMVFSIGLGIAVDDTIHYLARYCEEVRKGHSPEEAVERSTTRTGTAIVTTSILLLAGFGVLYSSAFPPNRSFAVLAGSVIATAVLADLFVLPALLLWVRPKVPGAPRTDPSDNRTRHAFVSE